MLYIIGALLVAVGFMGGGFITWLILNSGISGTVYFYDEPGEAPAMTVELDVVPEEIVKYDYVKFRVSHR